MTPTKKGRLIAFEGMDGVGKTTLVNATYDWLLDIMGVPVIKTSALSEGATEYGALIGDLLRKKTDAELEPLAEVLLIAAARRDNMESLINPTLDRGIWVISDRHCDSLYCYQRAGNPPQIQAILDLCDLRQEADLTFLIDLEFDHPRLKRDHRDRLESRTLEWWKKCSAEFRRRFSWSDDYNRRHRRMAMDGNQSVEELLDIVRANVIEHLLS